MNKYGVPTLTPEMKERNLYLTQTYDPAIFYMGFNMLDPIVGGDSSRARNLRHAISIAVNFDENIAIFYNGRGRPAQGPIPPSIFGFIRGEEGINPYVYLWENGESKRRPIEDAMAYMTAAGYKGGIDPKTKKPLILHYDAVATGGPDEKAMLDWMHKQFARIGISLNIRATQYNRFQEKMRSGNSQIYSWGWNADYPDPENFLFLLYGPNSKMKFGGENTSNYHNLQFDKLFDEMKNRENDPKRGEIIAKLVEIARYDAPWVFGFNPQVFTLYQQWTSPLKPNSISHNELKYLALDVPLRNKMRQLWNQPIIWPLALVVLVLLGVIIPILIAFIHKEKKPAARVKL
jgi:oligopeptide transport system substrate-binding protein